MELIDKIKQLSAEIQAQYLADDIPWVVGYSGGKDSTAVLQLVMYSLAKLDPEQRTKEVHVLSNDTLVENPSVVNYLDSQLGLIEKAGKEQLFSHNPGLFQVAKVVPKIKDRFWINLIGKGYPAPNRWFRWCTDRMKIAPTNDYIKHQVSRLGHALVILGTRSAESTNRANSMKKFDLKEITGLKIKKHTLPNSWMYSPIQDLSTQDVWAYLMQVPSFWRGDNKKLITMYRNASENEGECPLVIDTSTSSCGNSRFGCWVCTVVSKDKSMESLIQNGEDWMVPFLDFRDYLQEIRNNSDYRMTQKRTNHSYTKEKLGPFEFFARAEILQKVLEIEEETKQIVISKPELAAIQTQWNYDGNYEYSVGEIFHQVKGVPLMLDDKEYQLRKEKEYSLLSEVAKQHKLKGEHLRQMLEVETEFANYLRRGNIFDELSKKVERFAKETE